MCSLWHREKQNNIACGCTGADERGRTYLAQLSLVMGWVTVQSAHVLHSSWADDVAKVVQREGVRELFCHNLQFIIHALTEKIQLVLLRWPDVESVKDAVFFLCSVFLYTQIYLQCHQFPIHLPATLQSSKHP